MLDNSTGSAKPQIKLPTAEELTQQNISRLNIPASPSLQVYKPDFSGLEGSFNQILQSYDQFRTATQSQFDVQKAGLDTSLEQSMRNIEQAKEKTTQQFGKSRAQLAEDVFSLGRQTQAQMSARGLAGSGVEALANIQNRMAAGEAISGMANEFFEAQTQLVQAEEDTRTNYNNTLMALNSSLQSAMAQIMSQEASSRMDYTQMVENLKRQVIMDTNSVNQAMSEWNMARAELEQGARIFETTIQAVLGDETLSDNDKLAALRDFGYTDAQARQAIQQASTSSDAMLYDSIQRSIYNKWTEPGASKRTVENYVKGLIQQGISLDWNRLDLERPASPAAAKAPRAQSLSSQIQSTIAPEEYSGWRR